MTKKKVLGFLPILYGVEYLECCLTSIRNHCDKVHVSYTNTPSHSFTTSELCPDKEEDIYRICVDVLGDKLIWHPNTNKAAEAFHRNERYLFAKDFDFILSIDADECFDNIEEAIEFADKNEERYHGTRNYLNFWKSFDFVNKDSFAPIRIEKLSAENQLQNHENSLKVYHFSTAQNSNTIRYKNKIFGHANEIRPRWFEDIYMKWVPGCDIRWLHPVSLQIWENVEFFDKKQLPIFMLAHPNFFKEVIE